MVIISTADTMVKKRELRGFRIIKGEKRGSSSIKLLAMNGSRFIVIINKYILTLPWFSRSYEFPCLKDAEFFYEKLIYSKLKVRNSPLF